MSDNFKEYGIDEPEQTFLYALQNLGEAMWRMNQTQDFTILVSSKLYDRLSLYAFNVFPNEKGISAISYQTPAGRCHIRKQNED